MEVEIKEQLRQLAAAFLTGAGIGLWFDLLQPFRRAGGKWNHLFWDLLFLLTSGAAVFLLGQVSGAGMRLYFLCGVCAGACMYLWALHGVIREFQLQIKQFIQIKLGNIKGETTKPKKTHKNE